MRWPPLTSIDSLFSWVQRVIGLYQADYTALAGSAELAITATGTVQGDARALSATLSEVTTTPANSGVMVPPAGQVINTFMIPNMGANPLKIYPQVDGQINALGANLPFTLASGKVGVGQYASPTQLYFGELV